MCSSDLINTARKLRLCSFSQEKLHELIQETRLEYDQNKKGLMYIYRSDEALNEGIKKLKLLQPIMDKLDLLNTDDLIKIEPALDHLKSRIAGGIYCNTDESGNCHKFTQKLAKLCLEKGVFLKCTSFQLECWVCMEQLMPTRQLSSVI